jgi:dihydroorotate dehydrogenase electron transfer subunit
MPIQEKCQILDHQNLTANRYKLTLVSPYISSQAEAGQFVEVKCSDGYDPLLRRPISLHRINKEHKTFELLYEIVGKGTELLTKYTIGKELDILGPLGQGFKLDLNKKIAILIGGGMGIAPLLALAASLKNSSPKAVYLLLGAKTKELVVAEESLKSVVDGLVVATDDGSYGKKGLVSDLLLNLLDETVTSEDWGITTIYACGPKKMLKAISDITFQKKIDCQLSMEERMACGIGACKGCAVKTNNGYKMACKDGPVFNAREIVWN